MLTYHVVPGNISASELVAMIRDNGGRATLTTVQGGTITARLADGGVEITDANLMQSNGVIHVTDAVFLPR